MRKMVKFRLSRECREVSVNPAQVLWVCQYDNESSSLHFGKDCTVRVRGDVAEVTRMLETGLGSEAPGAVPSDGKSFGGKRVDAGFN